MNTKTITGLNEYQELCSRTCPNSNGVNMTLGLCGEAGEVADIVKKIEFHGHPFDDKTIGKLKLELGDVLWYVAMLASHLGFSLSDVAVANQEKLLRRYPDGFSSSDSINRELSTEENGTIKISFDNFTESQLSTIIENAIVAINKKKADSYLEGVIQRHQKAELSETLREFMEVCDE